MHTLNCMCSPAKFNCCIHFNASLVENLTTLSIVKEGLGIKSDFLEFPY